MPDATEPNPIVLQHVTQYFRHAFPNSPPSAFTPNLEIRKAFKLQTWKALADTFNDSGWMKAMKKTITQAQMEDPKVKSINDVALLITNKAGPKLSVLTGAEFKAIAKSKLNLNGVAALGI